MRFTVTQEMIIFLQACVTGVLIGLLYDVMRAIRIECKMNRNLIFVWDFLFCFCSAFITVCFVVGFAEANFRLYILVGEFLGSVFYFFTVSIVFLKVMKLLLRIFLRVAIRPFSWIMRKIKEIVCKMIEKTIFFIKNNLKNKAYMVYNGRKIKSENKKLRRISRGKNKSKAKKQKN